MDLAAIQSALREAAVDGWLFCDFHWFYWVPADGRPVRLAHRVEPRRLDAVPGDLEYYTAWTELHEQLKAILGPPRKIAMQYSPLNNIPYVSVVDAGTVDLVRSFGHEVVSSADLVQRFEAVMDEAGLASHRAAGEIVQAIKDEAFARLGDALRDGKAITENDVKDFILERFAAEGLTSDGAVPIVGFNDHPADPHFEPTPENAYTLKAGDTILIDLWARRDDPDGVYYDVTWCGFAGTEPPAEYVRIFETVRDARDAALALVRERFAAGRPCHGWEVDDACREVVRQAGYADRFVHRTGHSIGREVHGNGVNIDNLETRDDRLLVPGVCFSIEPGIYLPDRMAVRSEIDVFLSPEGEVVVSGPMQRELILLD